MTTTEAVDVESTVRAYYAIVGDLASTEADLDALLDTGICVVEQPNALLPHGATRDRAAVLAGFRAGKHLLQAQQLDVLDVLVNGDRAAVRARWSGTIGVAAGGFAAGTVLVAHIAAFVTVRAGRVAMHETFDCYEPFQRVP